MATVSRRGRRLVGFLACVLLVEEVICPLSVIDLGKKKNCRSGSLKVSGVMLWNMEIDVINSFEVSLSNKCHMMNSRPLKKCIKHIEMNKIDQQKGNIRVRGDDKMGPLFST